MPEEVKTDNKNVEASAIKPYLAINVEKGGRKYMFSMEVGSPLGEAYDAAYVVLSELLEMSKKAAENAKPKKDEESEEKK